MRVAAAPEPAGTRGLRARLVDGQAPAAQFVLVESGDGVLRLFVGAHFDECETSSAARGMVASAEDTTAAERPPAEPPEVDPYPSVRPPSRADGSPTVTAPARDGTDLNVA